MLSPSGKVSALPTIEVKYCIYKKQNSAKILIKLLEVSTAFKIKKYLGKSIILRKSRLFIEYMDLCPLSAFTCSACKIHSPQKGKARLAQGMLKILNNKLIKYLCSFVQRGLSARLTEGLFCLSKNWLILMKIRLDLLKIAFTILPSRVPRATFLCTRKAETLTSINLEKSRQTSAIIPSGIKSEFNDDFLNFAPLKLNLFNSRLARTSRAKYACQIVCMKCNIYFLCTRRAKNFK